jgi:NAD(P)H dehydrogenase (quinone)
MKNVLIISGHPDLKNSIANKAILEELAKKLPEAEIRKLDELYPDYQMDVKAEQAALVKADIIVFQYPTHWYSVPALLKVYIDIVMEHSWAYGSKGNALKGKKLITSTTTGGKASAYTKEGIERHEIGEFNYFLEQYAELCKMEFTKLFCSFGMAYVPGVSPEEKKTAILESAKKHADEMAEFIKTL